MLVPACITVLTAAFTAIKMETVHLSPAVSFRDDFTVADLCMWHLVKQDLQHVIQSTTYGLELIIYPFQKDLKAHSLF